MFYLFIFQEFINSFAKYDALNIQSPTFEFFQLLRLKAVKGNRKEPCFVFFM